MSVFQMVAGTVLGLLVLRELLASFRRGRWIRLLRLAVWLAAAVAILDPLLIQRVADLLGIGRGADVVLYLFVLAFLWVSFFLYSCHLRVQRQVTQLARHIAIQEARRGHESPGTAVPGLSERQ
ncbi:DUF2304 domain-containing protein [Limnoglobus roseus]|uniref:DUF2304 domain-containing protein n=1 Tax=Limnoglobus roseus TaxID=2598579 RepID=A0A5C1A7V3_9BACT|nr:DUF2304 domain-containing protein [Limnoglobus roseus]QEL13248.1 hypothetical protein PX52LOC_00102 [Limnoglobus roseus]